MCVIKDIVDTEPSYGNVWKMLLGTIDPWFDGDDGDDDDDGSVSNGSNAGHSLFCLQTFKSTA
jgi:hypothetical protein